MRSGTQVNCRLDGGRGNFWVEMPSLGEESCWTHAFKLYYKNVKCTKNEYFHSSLNTCVNLDQLNQSAGGVNHIETLLQPDRLLYATNRMT